MAKQIPVCAIPSLCGTRRAGREEGVAVVGLAGRYYRQEGGVLLPPFGDACRSLSGVTTYVGEVKLIVDCRLQIADCLLSISWIELNWIELC